MQSNGSNLTAIDVQIDTEEYDDNMCPFDWIYVLKWFRAFQDFVTGRL
jgi:hypothetical protein